MNKKVSKINSYLIVIIHKNDSKNTVKIEKVLAKFIKTLTFPEKKYKIISDTKIY